MNKDIKELVDQLIRLAKLQDHTEYCDHHYDIKDKCNCEYNKHNAKVNQINRAIKDYFIKDQSLPMNFDLKCGAKVSGKIVKWDNCNDENCEHCSKIEEQVIGR